VTDRDPERAAVERLVAGLACHEPPVVVDPPDSHRAQLAKMRRMLVARGHDPYEVGWDAVAGPFFWFPSPVPLFVRWSLLAAVGLTEECWACTAGRGPVLTGEAAWATAGAPCGHPIA
jgi:hypothetical protein